METNNFLNKKQVAERGKVKNTKDAFGLLSFEDLEYIFNVRLFGLSEDDTEKELDDLRKEWNSMSENQRKEILKEYTNYAN